MLCPRFDLVYFPLRVAVTFADRRHSKTPRNVLARTSTHGRHSKPSTQGRYSKTPRNVRARVAVKRNETSTQGRHGKTTQNVKQGRHGKTQQKSTHGRHSETPQNVGPQTLYLNGTKRFAINTANKRTHFDKFYTSTITLIKRDEDCPCFPNPSPCVTIRSSVCVYDAS